MYTRLVGEHTLVNFYQVTRATSNTCEVRELRKKIQTQNYDEQQVVPIPDDFISDPIRRKVEKSGCLMIEPGLYAWPWDGLGVWQTVIIYMP